MLKSTKTFCLILTSVTALAYFGGRLSYKLLSKGVLTNSVSVPGNQVPKDFEEAYRHFVRNGISYDPSIPVKFTDPVTFNLYLKLMDPYAEYLDAVEYRAFVASQRDSFTGVGMEIETNENGQIVCFPYSDSPASRSGIENNDILEAVEGRRVEGLSIYRVAQLLSKKNTDEVNIAIIKKDGMQNNLVIKRQYFLKSSVAAEFLSGMHIIRIKAFTRSTKRDLNLALKAIGEDSVIVLDIRDNPGGDFYKAIDSAMIFLEKNKKIVTIKHRQTEKVFASTTMAYHKDATVYIWQNQNTASAAEVFSAALTENKRAVSIGKISYGKGIVQDIEELRGGAAIIFTSGYLLTPSGDVYHKKGLTPDHRLVGDQLSTDDYTRKTRDLIQKRRGK
jgi:carboxyl-terminal processing protease